GEKEGVGVTHGHDEQAEIVAPEAEVDLVDVSMQDETAVAADGALRPAGRPGRVEEGKVIVGAGAYRRLARRGAGDQRLVSAVSGRCRFGPEMDVAVTRERQVGADSLDAIDEVVLDDDGAGFGILDD